MIKLWKSKITPNKSGHLAEFICCLYMILHGYRIINRNYRYGTGKNTPFGEIDFIAVKNKRLFFCEVKKRNNDRDFLSAISHKQKQRIINASLHFIKQQKKFHSYCIEFDVFFVKLPFNITRIRNAFTVDKVI